jgi:hypothetical protein
MALAALMLLAAAGVAAAPSQGDTFLPVVLRQAPTPTLAVTPLPGACLAAGQVVRFRDWLADMPLEARSLGCFRLAELRDAGGSRLAASGVFIVVVAEVRNYGVQPGEVATSESFRLQATGGLRYAMAAVPVQDAAALTFGRQGVYTPIPAGVSVVQVFVFDPPTGAAGFSLVSDFPW